MKRKEFLQKSMVAGLGLAVLPLSGFRQWFTTHYMLVNLPKPKIHGRHGNYNPSSEFCSCIGNKEVSAFTKDIFNAELDVDMVRIQMELDGHKLSFSQRGNQLFYCIDQLQGEMSQNSTFQLLERNESFRLTAVRLSQAEEIELPVKKYSFVFSMNDGVCFDNNLLGTDGGILVQKDFKAKVYSEKDDFLLFLNWD